MRSEVSKGLRLVFAGELMVIISTIVELACSVLAATLSGSYSSLIPGVADRAVTAPAVILTVLALAGGSAILCGIILNIIGFRYLFPENRYFRIAFWFTLAELALVTVTSAVTFHEIWHLVMIVVEWLPTLVIVASAVSGISALAERLGNEELVKHGKALRHTFVVIYILILVLDILHAVMLERFSQSIPVRVLAVISVLLAVFHSVHYAMYLRKASKETQQ